MLTRVKLYLQQNGPPVLEVGGSRFQNHDHLEGDIVVGQRQPDHLSGFVPLDFEHATSDDHNRHPALNTKAKSFSVVFDGPQVNPVRSPEDLAKLFKDGKMKDAGTKAFIAPESEAAPVGFSKVDLPFMEHSDDAHELPSVFIAPVGFKVPEGYKGHPLPYDPAIPGVTVVHQSVTPAAQPPVVTSKPTSAKYNPTNLVKDKLRLAQKRPSLVDFYKNKARQEIRHEEEQQQQPAATQKKRRVLTKIVRRPFKPATNNDLVTNPFLTEEPPTYVEVNPVTPQTTQKVIIEDEKKEPTTEYLAPVEEEPVVVINSKEPAALDLSSFFQPTTQTEKEEEVINTTFLPPTPLAVNKPKQPTTQQEQRVLVTSRPSTPRSTTTTTTSTTTTTTTRKPTTAGPSFGGYEPTPFAKLQPVRKLDDRVRFKPSLSRLRPTPRPATPPTTTTATTAEPQQRLKYRKYGGGNRYEDRIFGQRIRSRKRPTFWQNRFQPTLPPAAAPAAPETTRTPYAEKPSKTDEYKKKFRPFFDQLYDKLTKNNKEQQQQHHHHQGKVEPDSVRRFWARRSTTTENPYTIDAQIFEVHPESGKIVKATRPTSRPKDDDYPTEEPVYEYVDDYALDYDVYHNQEQQQQQQQYPEQQPQQQYHEQQPQQQPESSPSPPLEYHEYSLPTEEVPKSTTVVVVDDGTHETADKHSTDYQQQQQQQQQPQQPATLPPLDPQTPYSYPEAPLNYDYVHNDIIDDGNLDYAESQRVEHTWNDVQILPSDDVS